VVKEEYFTAFKVEKHGFHFHNSFSVDNIVNEITGVDFDLLIDWNYGLCGGMCWAALDRYYGKEMIPERTTTPQEGNLFRELVRRQIDFLKKGWTISKTLLYQSLPTHGDNIPDEGSLGYKTQINEWPKIKEKLKDGIPVTMVLIRVLNPFLLAKNHSVVAIGYHYDTETKQVKIYAYDPNHPEEREKK